MENFGQIASFIWGTADLIRDVFKRGKYQDVILPLTVLRRIDCVLKPTRQKVLDASAKYKGEIENLDPLLRNAAGFAFYNTSRYDFETLLNDPPNIAANLRNWINGFSDNMREIIDKFKFDNTITELDENNLLFLVMERFSKVALHPDQISNHVMGLIFEELIRRFNEALDENHGEPFTPRDVVRLMANLLLSRDQDMLEQNHIVRKICDPCCGTGGMLTIAKEWILQKNPNAEIFLYGQEVNPETWAVCKSDLLMKTPEGHDADNIKLGSTFSNDQLAGQTFDYLLANPPYGKEWKMDKAAIQAEHDRGHAGRPAA